MSEYERNEVNRQAKRLAAFAAVTSAIALFAGAICGFCAGCSYYGTGIGTTNETNNIR